MEQHQSDKQNDKDTRNERPGNALPGNDRPSDAGQRGEGQRHNKPTHQRPGQDRSNQNRSGNERSERQNNQPRDNQNRDERSGRDDLSGLDRPSRDERMTQERQVPEKSGNEKSGVSTPGGSTPGQERSGFDRSGNEKLATDKPGLDRLVVGITLGDYNGIGPEVILKALQYNQMQRLCTPVIYGSMRVLNRYRNVLNMKDWNLNGIQHIGQASHKLTNVITCWSDQGTNQPGQPVQEIQPGKVTPEAGQAALACLQRGVEDLKAGKLDALITAPINKYNIQSEEFKFPGHTEYLAETFGAADSLMFLVSETLRVGVVTGHIPLGSVRSTITRERIQQKLDLMMKSLKQDFGISKPRIAVLGINPHAGEEGLLGNEEQEVIKPLIADLTNKGQLVFGPFAADGFFGTRSYKKFDAVLAMYHDQGLIPFKTIAFEEGVNFTAGLSIIRTSPDHGTAYDIAGKGIADETSMAQAIYLACDIARQRKEYQELEANKLQKQAVNNSL